MFPVQPWQLEWSLLCVLQNSFSAHRIKMSRCKSGFSPSYLKCTLLDSSSPVHAFFPRLLSVDSCHDNCSPAHIPNRLQQWCLLIYFPLWINSEAVLFWGLQGGSLQPEVRQAPPYPRHPVKSALREMMLWGAAPQVPCGPHSLTLET